MTHRQAHAENHTYVLLTNRISDWHWYVELMYCMEKYTNCFGDKRWDYENYWWDQSWVQQPAPEINNNLLVTFLLLFFFILCFSVCRGGQKTGLRKCLCGLGSWLKTGAVTITSKWWKPYERKSVCVCVCVRACQHTVLSSSPVTLSSYLRNLMTGS